MADVYMDRDATVVVFARVDYVNEDTGATDPTSYTVTMAVVATGTRPVSGDFSAATWAARSVGGYKAKRTVTGLTAGRYDVYVKIAASPETWIDKSPDTLVVR